MNRYKVVESLKKYKTLVHKNKEIIQIMCMCLTILYYVYNHYLQICTYDLFYTLLIGIIYEFKKHI